MSDKFRGSMVALPTPFRKGLVDEGAFAALCDRQIESGTDALVVGTTTGESASLTHAEQRRIIEVAVEVADNRVPVIAGGSTASTEFSIALARQAEEAGANALLCVTPYYVRPTQNGVQLHVAAIHDRVGIPLILYDVPTRTACALADDTVARLAELPRVIGLKDATGDIGRVARLRHRTGSDFRLLSGDDGTQAAHRRAGGDGCISVTANIAPAISATLQVAWNGGNVDDFARLTAILAPVDRILFVETNPIPVKHALRHMGLIGDGLRLPLTSLSPEHHHVIDAAVDEVLAVEQVARESWPGSGAKTAHEVAAFLPSSHHV